MTKIRCDWDKIIGIFFYTKKNLVCVSKLKKKIYWSILLQIAENVNHLQIIKVVKREVVARKLEPEGDDNMHPPVRIGIKPLF